MAEVVGVVWAEFVSTSIDSLPHIKVKLTVKAERAALPKGPGENTAMIHVHSKCYCIFLTEHAR